MMFGFFSFEAFLFRQMWEEQLLNEAYIFTFLSRVLSKAEKLDKVLFLYFLFRVLSMERKFFVISSSLGWNIWTHVFLGNMSFFLFVVMPSFVKRWLLSWVFIRFDLLYLNFLWMIILFVIDFETKLDYVGVSKGF